MVACWRLHVADWGLPWWGSLAPGRSRGGWPQQVCSECSVQLAAPSGRLLEWTWIFVGCTHWFCKACSLHEAMLPRACRQPGACNLQKLTGSETLNPKP